MSREIPLLATDDVVRRILSGAQTQDRRPLNPQPVFSQQGGVWWPRAPDGRGDPKRALHYGSEAHFRKGWPVDFGPTVGDAHWIRECWGDGLKVYPYSPVLYRASESADLGSSCRWQAETDAALGRKHEPAEGCRCHFRWRPSIHMPRRACRIVKPIVRSFVERVQEITEAGARAEGAPDPLTVGLASYRESFYVHIWEPLYPGSWERNDWVSGVEWAHGNEVRP